MSQRTKECKDQLLISRSILLECKRRKKNLSMAWIDYGKAFDRVPHSWIVGDLIGINMKLFHLLRRLCPTGEHVCA
jgi:hypothetical protein